jgi:hypothetical protein
MSFLRGDRAWRGSETESNQFNRPRVDDAITEPNYVYYEKAVTEMTVRSSRSSVLFGWLVRN